MYDMSIFAERFRLLVALFTFCITSLNPLSARHIKNYVGDNSTPIIKKKILAKVSNFVQIPSQPVRKWTSTSGSTLEAKFVEFLEKEYVLEKTNKDRLMVPRGTLSDEDMVYVDWLEARATNPGFMPFANICDNGYDISNPNHMRQFDSNKLKTNTSLGKWSRKDMGFVHSGGEVCKCRSRVKTLMKRTDPEKYECVLKSRIDNVLKYLPYPKSYYRSITAKRENSPRAIHNADLSGGRWQHDPRFRNIHIILRDHETIKDLSPLQEFENLKEVTFYDTHIKDLNPIVDLDNIKELRVINNLVEDFYPLTKMRWIENIDLAYNKIRYLDKIPDFQNTYLENISFRGNPLSEDPYALLNIEKRDIEKVGNFMSVWNFCSKEWTKPEAGHYGFRVNLSCTPLERHFFPPLGKDAKTALPYIKVGAILVVAGPSVGNLNSFLHYKKKVPYEYLTW